MRTYKVKHFDKYKGYLGEQVFENVPEKITLLEAICIFDGTPELSKRELEKTRIKYA